MVVQWLGLRAFTVEDTDSVSGWGIKTLQAAWHRPKKKKLKIFYKHGSQEMRGKREKKQRGRNIFVA